MRRKADNFLNATQILKVAQIEKGRRTKILEREVQIPGTVFEKVQGGYGKYQGTWIPYEKGVEVAQRYEVDHLLKDILDDVTISTRKPPPAAAVKKRKVSETQIQVPQVLPVPKEVLKPSNNNEKYRGVLMSVFLNHDNFGLPSLLTSDCPPPDFDPNMIIDDQGHCALQWCAALARINVLQILVENLGADVCAINFNGESALVRAILVTNCYENDCFGELLAALGDNVISLRDKKDRTVLHHIVLTSSVKGRAQASLYYMEQIINYVRESQLVAQEENLEYVSVLDSIVNMQDKNGDTALNMAARLGNRNLVSLLVDACNADVTIANKCGLRPIDFGMEDISLKPIFQKKLSGITQLQDVHRYTVPASQDQTPTFDSDSLNVIVNSMEVDPQRYDQAQQELVQARRTIAKLSARVVEMQSQLGLASDSIVDAALQDERHLSREQVLQRRCGQLIAILKANGIEIQISQLSQQNVQSTPVYALLASILKVDPGRLDDNFIHNMLNAIQSGQVRF